MEGVHLLGEWYDCRGQTLALNDALALKGLCLTLTQAAGLVVVGDSFYQFEPLGVTGAVLLAESHLAIHTWPERNFITIDVYVCNYLSDNTAKAGRLFNALRSAFNPQRVFEQRIRRGGKDGVPVFGVTDSLTIVE